MTTAKKASIIGAGQGGLHLAHGLLADGWQVRVISDRTPADYLGMHYLSGHTLQYTSMNREAQAGIDLYERVPDNRAVGLTFTKTSDGATIEQHFSADFASPAFALDTRYKYATLLRGLEAAGATVEYRAADVADLEALTEAGEVVFVAAGKGSLSGIFEIDPDRTVYDRPQRNLMIVAAAGVDLPQERRNRINFCLYPGVGEVFLAPAQHKDGSAINNVLLEAVPGGPMDEIMKTADNPAAGLAAAKRIVERFAGWESGAVENLALADEAAMLRGAVRPCVRYPVATLPSGRHVYGLGDVLAVLDPVAGQGGNLTVAGTHHLLRELRERDSGTVEPDWYRGQFEDFWEREGRYYADFSNALLEPPTDAARMIIEAATTSTAVANRFAATFADPADLVRHLSDPAAGRMFVDDARSGRAVAPADLLTL